MNNDLLYQIALTRIPQIGHVQAKQLLKHFPDIHSIFRAPRQSLEKIDGIGSVRADAIKKFKDFSLCESELRFIEKNKISTLFYNTDEYPKRLHHCHDSPVLLYFKGNLSLNGGKFISIAGTRNNTEYGKFICEKLIEELSKYDITIISGLAYGIDTIAHRSALKNKLNTIAVLAHGLDRIYPHVNKKLAIEIMEHGGLLTDYCSGTKPDKQNFPGRNRITAGLCDALVVVETGSSGGSQITANIAHSYNKDIFAFPGRTSDPKSEGCLQLIQSQKAALITSAKDLLDAMGWHQTTYKSTVVQRALFSEIGDHEKKLLDLFISNPVIEIDQISLMVGLSRSQIAGALLNMEMSGFLQALPGKKYKLADTTVPC